MYKISGCTQWCTKTSKIFSPSFYSLTPNKQNYEREKGTGTEKERWGNDTVIIQCMKQIQTAQGKEKWVSNEW